MLRVLRAGAIAVVLARRASALEAVASSDAPTGTLVLSPRDFDAESGQLQLDVGVSFAPPGSRLLVAFRCVLCARVSALRITSRTPLCPRSSSEGATVAPSCWFERAAVPFGEPASTLTAVFSTSAVAADACTGPCAPSLNSTCGFAVAPSQVDGGSQRFSGHLQVWLDDGAGVARVFSGTVAVQLPLLEHLMAAIGGIMAANCAILVWVLELVACVLKPKRCILCSPRPPPPPLLAPPPPPDSDPVMPLYSMLQLCANQDDLMSSQQPAARGDAPVYVGETYCLEQIVFNLPLGAALVRHALYQNGTQVPTSGMPARMVWQPNATAAVQFPYTFMSLGLVVLESVSVFRIDGANITTSSAGREGGTQRVSTWRSQLTRMASGAADVRIMQRAEFDLSAVAAGTSVAPRKQSSARVLSPEEQATLGASLAAAQFTVRAGASPRNGPGSLISL